MLEKVVATLIDKETGLFVSWNREERLDIYQTGLGWPLLTTTMDGLGTAAPWDQAFGKRRSETLFVAIANISLSWSGFYIKHQDDAYAEVSWSRTLESGSTLGVQLFEEFLRNPAAEGGASFLGLFLDDASDMILFSYAPTEFFRISLFGAMKTRLPEELRRCAG